MISRYTLFARRDEDHYWQHRALGQNVYWIRDAWWDRVSIMYADWASQGIAVWIDNKRILTSGNSLQKFIHYPQLIIVYTPNGNQYSLRSHGVVCSKRIIGRTGNPEELHGMHGTHAPVHDLVVMSVGSPGRFSDDKKRGLISINERGPILSKLADEEDFLNASNPHIAFCGFGYIDSQHIGYNRYLEISEYNDNTVIVNCDEWIPREWGRFICIANLEWVNTVQSGAPLYYNDVLYGIGSFSLQKGDESILVFTDVRPYRELINNTCL